MVHVYYSENKCVPPTQSPMGDSLRVSSRRMQTQKSTSCIIPFISKSTGRVNPR